MSHEKTDLEQQYDEEAQRICIIEWQEKQKNKKEAKRQRIYNFKIKIKKFFTRR